MGKKSKTTPLKAIRAHCLECMCGSVKEVKLCEMNCPLHIYRFGKNPTRKGIGGRGKTKQGQGINKTDKK